MKGHPILKSLLDVYENMTFVQEDGSLNLKPCPIIQTEVMEQYGFKRNGKFQARNGVAVFPWEVFAPFHIYECYGRITENTHSIHHYAASWVESDKMMVRKRYEDRIRNIIASGRRKTIMLNGIRIAESKDSRYGIASRIPMWQAVKRRRILRRYAGKTVIR